MNNFVKEVITLPIKFAYGLLFELDLFVMPLSEDSQIVLDYDCFKRTNLSINWKREVF